MADRRIVASGTTRVFGVGIKTTYTPAPRLYLRNVTAPYRIAMVPTGGMVILNWGDELKEFDVEVARLSYATLAREVTQRIATVGGDINWIPTKVGLYAFRVRERWPTAGPWIDSLDSPADGARGWIVQSYLAPVSGGGID